MLVSTPSHTTHTRCQPQKPPTSHNDSWVGSILSSKTTNESLWLVGGFRLPLAHDASPKNHPWVMTTRGWPSSHLQNHQRVIMTRWWVSTLSRTWRWPRKPPTCSHGSPTSPSPTPPTSHYDSLVGFESLSHTMPTPKTTHESQRLVGELSWWYLLSIISSLVVILGT